MDTLAFVIALIAFLAVGYWYFENEAKNAGGSLGAFALRMPGAPAAEAAEGEAETGSDSPRYRTRHRVAPVRADRLRKAPDSETYREKESEAPAYRKRVRFGDAPLKDL